jgi:cell division initiation protein
MKIGPVDIRNHTFKKKMNGVDDQEVRAYLDLVADRLEEVIVESEELRAKIDRLGVRVEEYETLEKSLRNSLISAEQLADERLGIAEKESRIILKNAELDAEKVLVGARGELARLRAEMDDLRRQKVTYVERFRALLRSQFKILEASVESFDPDHDNSAARDVLDTVARVGKASTEQQGKDSLGSYLGEEGLFSSAETTPGRIGREGD